MTENAHFAHTHTRHEMKLHEFAVCRRFDQIDGDGCISSFFQRFFAPNNRRNNSKIIFISSLLQFSIAFCRLSLMAAQTIHAKQLLLCSINLDAYAIRRCHCRRLRQIPLHSWITLKFVQQLYVFFSVPRRQSDASWATERTWRCHINMLEANFCAPHMFRFVQFRVQNHDDNVNTANYIVPEKE